MFRQEKRSNASRGISLRAATVAGDDTLKVSHLSCSWHTSNYAAREYTDNKTEPDSKPLHRQAELTGMVWSVEITP